MAYVREIRQMADWYRALTGVVRRATARALIKTATNATAKAKRNAKDRFTGTQDRPKTGNLLNSIFAGFHMSGAGKDRRIGTAMVAVASQKGDRGTRPYGRIQEYGGTIVPKRAKNLWIPAFGPKSSGDLGKFRDVTPREFMKGIDEQRKRRIAFTRRGRKGATNTGWNYAGRKKRKEGGSIPTVNSLRGKFAFLRWGGMVVAGFDKVTGRGETARHKFIALFYLRKSVTLKAKRYVNDAVDEEFPQFKRYLTMELGED